MATVTVQMVVQHKGRHVCSLIPKLHGLGMRLVKPGRHIASCHESMLFLCHIMPPVLVALPNQPMMFPPTTTVLIAVFSWGEYD